MERILIIEDDTSIREELITLLQTHGYLPVTEPPCELALLDVNLPDISGFEICKKLKENSDIPVIFLTARDGAEDEILGFDVGADDYIKKPYNSAILLARIARLLKKNGHVFTIRELTFDFDSYLLYYCGNSIPLTKTEARIVYCLVQKPICGKEEIIESLWADSCYVDENTLYVNINRIRDKLNSLGAEGYLQTVRGVGYRL